jgi:hypothetical protein
MKQTYFGSIGNPPRLLHTLFDYTHSMDFINRPNNNYEAADLMIGNWEEALSSYRSSTPFTAVKIAENAMSSSARFDYIYSKHNILSTIHTNFGILENPDDGLDGPNGKSLWEDQVRLVAEARTLLDEHKLTL